MPERSQVHQAGPLIWSNSRRMASAAPCSFVTMERGWMTGNVVEEVVIVKHRHRRSQRPFACSRRYEDSATECQLKSLNANPETTGGMQTTSLSIVNVMMPTTVPDAAQLKLVGVELTLSVPAPGTSTSYLTFARFQMDSDDRCHCAIRLSKPSKPSGTYNGADGQIQVQFRRQRRLHVLSRSYAKGAITAITDERGSSLPLRVPRSYGQGG